MFFLYKLFLFLCEILNLECGKPRPAHGRLAFPEERRRPACGKLRPAHGRLRPAHGKLSPAHGRLAFPEERRRPECGKLRPAYGRLAFPHVGQSLFDVGFTTYNIR